MLNRQEKERLRQMHSFQLEHVLNPLNLMCGQMGSWVDSILFLTCSTSWSVQLNATQTRRAQGAAKQWQ